MRAILFTLLLVPCTAALAATVYKWVDQNGVTHYSDQPNPGAEKLKVEAAQTYQSSAAAPANRPHDIILPNQQSGPTYSACTIASPTNDEVFTNVNTVSGSIRLQPVLQAGHRIALALDGKAVPGMNASSTTFTLTEVARGSHTLNLQIQDANGGTVCSSPPVTFHVRQPSVQAPRPANRPRF